MTDPIRPPAQTSIIEAAFELFRRNPGTPLGDIAERAGVGRATLHRHFPTRDDLVRAMAIVAIEEMDAAAEAACEGVQSHGAALKHCLAALIPLGDRHGFLALEPLENDPTIASAYARQTRETADSVDAAKDEGVFDPAIPTDWIVQAYDGLLYTAWDSVKSGTLTANQAAELAWRTLTTGTGPAHSTAGASA